MSTITIDDALADHYQALHPGKPVSDTCANQLRRFQSIPPTERIIVIRGPQRQAIEEALGGIADITSADGLIAAIRQRMVVTLGGYDIPFTDASLQEIGRRATKEGLSHEAMLDKVAKEALQGILDAV